MGQRANLIVRRNGGWSMYYTHWRANTLDADLFWGPAYATVFIQAQTPCDPDAWLDEVWAEGGAVVDHDARVLLWFGGNDILADASMRRVHLDLMSRAWPGWQVRWAREGVVNISGYVGVPKDTVLRDEMWSVDLSDMSPPQGGQSLSVGAYRLPDGGMALFPLGSSTVEEYVAAGPDLLDAARPAGQAELNWSEWSADFPAGGFLVDQVTHTLAFWSSWPMPNAVARAAQRWPGWSVRCHWDDHDSWATSVGPALRFPATDTPTLRKRVGELLLRRTGNSGAVGVVELARRLEAEAGGTVEIHPNALNDSWIDLPLERKQAILDAALAGDPMPPALSV